MEFFVFVCSASMILVGAVGVIVRKHPVHAALSLVLTLFGVAVLFVAQEAHFLAAVQVIVYAGAIVVLFLFVIMLLGVDRVENLRTEPLSGQRPLAVLASLGLVAVLITAILRGNQIFNERGTGLNLPDSQNGPDANTVQLAESIFSQYVVAFEVTSVLLVIAVVGTVLLTRRTRAATE
ncbi:MAG: NADH-quinone oxidoreductase subunit J [Actinomycetota bacterium]|nr:NADH-quinone oxidoreductase subunit J [Actinomycetota bacterium]